ncbi:hypothetical protein BGX28_000670, partial [Mortierella sp. GBA30]
KPKGVMLEHQGVVNLVRSRQSTVGLDSRARLSQFFSFSFDSSVCEIFPALCLGATLHLLEDSTRLDRHQLWKYLEQHSITHVVLTPAVLQDCKDLSPLSTPTTFIIAGEALSAALIRTLHTMIPNCTVINEYGPTETTVAAVSWKCTTDIQNNLVPIGRPIANKRLYVLDGNGKPVPLGTVGELHVGGVGVARGYLNRLELTAERFLLDPFADDVKARMYRTGDLVRYLPDGNLAYLGRNDHQVKIRGFRIELGEIEARLRDHTAVTEAAVVTSGEGSNKRLVAYVIAQPDDEAAGAQLALTLRAHLATQLPEYMVPSAFVRMDSFPLTPNGKLDRRALPDPSDDDFARETFEEPQGEIETALASIWADLLQLERVSRHDSFFALGGHSLLAIQMISRLQRLGYSVSARALFDARTLSVLAQSVIQHREIVIPPNLITPGVDRVTPDLLPLIHLTQSEIDIIIAQVPGGTANIQDIYALSPLQDGILFHHLMAKHGDPYLLFVATEFNDRESLDRYLAALQHIVDRHDILRTSFVWENLSTPAQIVWREAPLSITELQLNPADGPITQQLKSTLNPHHHRIDLRQAPLLRYVTAQESDGRWILAKLQHHLIGDHSTLETLNAEVRAFLEGCGDTLPSPQPYRNLIAQVRLGLNPEEHERFFKEMLADFDTPSLPYGVVDIHGDGSAYTESHRMLSPGLNKELRSQAKRLGVSLASLCHLAWALVIARTSGQHHVVFGTVLFGRMQAAENSTRAMGLFINTLPIRIDLDRHSVEESVRATQASLATLLEHEHASLALAQRCSNIAAGMPLFSALLNYRHNAAPSSSTSVLTGMKYLDSQELTNYPFDLSVEDFGTSLGLTAQALQPIESDRICGYMQQALESLVMALEHTPSVPVADLEVIPTEEHTMLLQTLNTTQENYPDQLCLHHLFEQQVARAPDAIAVVHDNQSLTYSELNQHANRLAHHLIALGVHPEDLVAICVERSPGMIIGILAILKAGGAYVPLDPSYASDRLRDILDDAAPTIL